MTNTTKLFFVLFVVCGVVLIYMIYSANIFDSIRKFGKLIDVSNNKTRYILYWTPFWNTNDFCMGYGSKPFENCEYKNCFATNNRSLIPVQKFDALIFHGIIYNRNNHGIPKTRLPHQIYIFMNLEAPIHRCPDLKQYSSFFNWTMTYRFDSDIITRHGNIIKEKTNYSMPSREFLKKKTRMVSWLVSNCHTESERERITNKIRKFIPVDIYGKCGKFKCARKPDIKTSPRKCYCMIEEKYKFYLSFENSYCKDYATEKLYNVLLRDVVPIVYGAGNYNLSAPPNSIINVEDFKNAKELTDYLHYLDKNVDEYLKYFEWKTEYKVIRSWQPSACQICKKLNQPLKDSIYHDLHSWWWGENKDMCKTGNDLPKLMSDNKTAFSVLH